MRLRILIVSGIWPPDVGGPASHAPEVGRFLTARGHDVRALTMGSGTGPAHPCSFPVTSVPRGQSRLLRVPRAAVAVARAARRADVIYATGLYYKTILAATLNAVPVVAKLTTDPAFERARSVGLFRGDVAAFQAPQRGVAIRWLKLVRRSMLARSAAVVIPSRYLADVARGWGLREERLTVVPNPAPAVGRLAPREVVRRRLGISAMTLVFVGRLVPAKNLPLAISALRRVPDVRLVIIGDGPERRTVEALVAQRDLNGRVMVKGALPRSEAVQWLRAADAALLSSSWENLPHAAVEAIAAGTPVVATAVGGVPEVVEPGVNGLLVAPGDELALAEAIRTIATNPGLAARLREGAAATAERFDADRAFAAIERVLLTAAQTARPWSPVRALSPGRGRCP